MPTRQTLPTRWLMTDQRLGETLWEAIERVPRGGGVVLRHHRSDRAFGERVARLCAVRGLFLAVAGDVALAHHLGVEMVHNPVGEAGGLLISRSVHSLGEARAERDADLLFVSPVYATSSHPGETGLGLRRALELASITAVRAIALGGMNAVRGAQAIDAGFHGWAGIDCWTGDEFRI